MHEIIGLGEAVLVGEEALLPQVIVGRRHAGEGRRGEAELLAVRLAHVPHRLTHVAPQLGVHEALESPVSAAVATLDMRTTMLQIRLKGCLKFVLKVVYNLSCKCVKFQTFQADGLEVGDP